MTIAIKLFVLGCLLISVGTGMIAGDVGASLLVMGVMLMVSARILARLHEDDL